MTVQIHLPHVHWARRHGYHRHAMCGGQLYQIHYTRDRLPSEPVAQLNLCQDNMSTKPIKMAEAPADVTAKAVQEWAEFVIATHRLHLVALGRPITPAHPNQACPCVDELTVRQY